MSDILKGDTPDHCLELKYPGAPELYIETRIKTFKIYLLIAYEYAEREIQLKIYCISRKFNIFQNTFSMNIIVN